MITTKNTKLNLLNFYCFFVIFVPFVVNFRLFMKSSFINFEINIGFHWVPHDWDLFA